MPNNRTLLLAVAATCFALVGFALYLQHAKDMLPCPLCVIQRYAFLAAGIFSLVAALANKPKVWTVLAAAGALTGIGYVAKHLYVLANPGFSCGIDPMETFLNKIPTAEVMPWLFRADGLCEDARDTLFGLSIPQWSGVWFVIITIALLFALVRRSR
ncbi:disulfide bond formation protein B [Massilia sp. GCM10020059]|uniref:Disulfide bond formation protein B n=1 Tax=Massilia agrisoli TaxID=2892444 RepID=A0ABS8IQK2_9BURK|nr:disulfide bond formation protein B [Massilia agrisoli]MCC6070216.1 disulfide bond formation protein B [Massilia agrisoli]